MGASGNTGAPYSLYTAMRVTVDMRGLNEAFKRAPQLILKEMAKGAKEGLTDMQRDAQANHAYESKGGYLRRATKVDFNNWNGRGLFIDSGIAPYGRWVHQGTRPHKIYPRNSAALSFVGKDGRSYVIPRNMGHMDTRAYWRGQAALKGFILGYKGYVQHPGTKPDPFIYQAVDRGMKNLISKISAGIGRAIIKLGLRGK
jgi:hypothetical protein